MLGLLRISVKIFLCHDNSLRDFHDSYCLNLVFALCPDFGTQVVRCDSAVSSTLLPEYFSIIQTNDITSLFKLFSDSLQG